MLNISQAIGRLYVGTTPGIHVRSSVPIESTGLVLQAGIVIAHEAGSFVTGSRNTPHDVVVIETTLTDRLYLVIRSVTETPVRAV